MNLFSEITLYHYLFISLCLFLIGILGSIISKHVIKLLISIEIMLTGININFIAFGTYCDNLSKHGYIFSLFYIAIGAIELAIGLYLFYIMYKYKKSENIEAYGDL